MSVTNKNIYFWSASYSSFVKYFVSKIPLVEVYKDIQQKYPLYLIEDGFDQDDFDGWSALKTALGKSKWIH